MSSSWRRFGPLRWRDAVVRRGFTTLLLVALLVSVLAVALTQALVSASRGGPDARQQLDSLRAHYLADSGLEFVQSVISFQESLSGASANTTCTSSSVFSPSVINALSGYGITLTRTANGTTRTCRVVSVGCVGQGCSAGSSASASFAQRRVQLDYMLSGTRGFADSASSYKVSLRNTGSKDALAIMGLALNPYGGTAQLASASCSTTATCSGTSATVCKCDVPASPSYSGSGNSFWDQRSSGADFTAITASEVFALTVPGKQGNKTFGLAEPTLTLTASRQGVVTALLVPKPAKNTGLNDILLGVGSTTGSYVSNPPIFIHSGTTNPSSGTVNDGYRGQWTGTNINTLTRGWCRHATANQTPALDGDLLAFVVSGDSTGDSLGYTREITSVLWDTAVQSSGTPARPGPKQIPMTRLVHYPDLNSSCTPLASTPDGCEQSPSVGFDNSSFVEIFYLYNPTLRGIARANQASNWTDDQWRTFSFEVDCNPKCDTKAPKPGTWLKVLEYGEAPAQSNSSKPAGRFQTNTRVVSVSVTNSGNRATIKAAKYDWVASTSEWQQCVTNNCSKPVVDLVKDAVICGGVCALFREADSAAGNPANTQVQVTRSDAGGHVAGGFLCLRTGGIDSITELSAFSGRTERRDWTESITQ